MYREEKKDATQRKKLKHADYKSKEEGSSVDAWSQQHPKLHKHAKKIDLSKARLRWWSTMVQQRLYGRNKCISSENAKISRLLIIYPTPPVR